MKNILKGIGTAFLILVVLIIAGIVFIIFKFATAEPEIMAPEDYETSVQTGGEIEAKYLAHGKYKVSYFEGRIVKLSATPLRNRPHMVFCTQGTS